MHFDLLLTQSVPHRVLFSYGTFLRIFKNCLWCPLLVCSLHLDWSTTWLSSRSLNPLLFSVIDKYLECLPSHSTLMKSWDHLGEHSEFLLIKRWNLVCAPWVFDCILIHSLKWLWTHTESHLRIIWSFHRERSQPCSSFVWCLEKGGLLAVKEGNLFFLYVCPWTCTASQYVWLPNNISSSPSVPLPWLDHQRTADPCVASLSYLRPVHQTQPSLK